jgi:long-subunit acyl-CoA synthetase (AMP-forming)
MESSTATPGADTQAAPTTMAEAFRQTAGRHADRTALRNRDGSVELTFAEWLTRSDAIAGGLVKLGLQPHENVALLIGNRPEFNICDIAVMTAGATPFSIYNTSSPEQIEYVVSDAEARIAMVETSYLPGFLAAWPNLPKLETIIVVDGPGGDAEGVIGLADVEGSNPDFDSDASVAQITPDDVLTLIYTSGTTGPPKGVQLTHGNLISLVNGVQDIIPFPEDARVISWLPNAHIAERGAHHYLPLTYGFTITCCDDPKTILQVLPEVKPTWFFAVPRIWEKLKAGLETMLAAQPDEAREKAQGALSTAIEKVRLEQKGEPVPDEVAAAVAAADESMFAGLRAMLGLDEAVSVNVGAAPTPVEVLEFFHAIGIPVAELWGMSETSGGGTCNPVGKVKIGTVGPPLPGFEIKLAEDGEVLVRGPGVMSGYRNQPEKTAETIDPDGWLATGDIGQIDEDGYLKIVDRKKELIINAAGKNMSPANIEATLKTSSPLIGQACAIGDARPYNTALIVLDADFAPAWAAKQGIEDTSLEALASDEQIRAAIQEAMDAANAQLSRVEQIKKFTIVPGDWLPGGDELTPTMKLKRKPIDAKYASQIGSMYGG